jgi:predicted TIM-barrel fold metal-dependent hydrolase
MNQVTRRQFLASSAVGALAVTASAAPEEKPIPIVDPHLHLWDLSRFQLAWVEKGSPLARSFIMKDYLAATQGLNVVKAVYMEVDVVERQQTAEAQYVLDICRQGNTPMAAAVISGRPASDGFRKYLEQFKGNRYLKGVRQVLHVKATPAGYCLAPNFVRGMRVLDEMGLSFDLCMRPTELADGVKLVESMPNLRFILDHCGNGPVRSKDLTQWRRDMDRMARQKNVVCKVSGIVADAAEKWTADDLAPVINHTLDAFGPERVMFAGDWPVCTLRATFRQWVDALKSIVRQRPAEQQRKLFHDNAVRFYGLK